MLRRLTWLLAKGVRSLRKGTAASMEVWNANVYVEYRIFEASAWIWRFMLSNDGTVWRRCAV